MKKDVILNVSLVLIAVVASILLVILVFNSIKKDKATVSSNNDISQSKFEVEEIEVAEEEIEEIGEVVTIPELKPGIYYIKVNNEMNTVTIYIKDDDGEYTIPVKAMVCSTGDDTFKDSTYKLTGKRWEWRALFGNVFGQYTTHIYGNILFHSVPYVRNYDPSSLEYWEYDKLGTTASAGCIRLKVEDAKWIYENCLQGTFVEFYSSSDPGPLGKPEVDKISDYEEYRDWDPTDPDERNPWKNFEAE